MYVPADNIDYYMQTGKLPKALAAHAADADLNGICVPQRQDDGSYKDAQGAVMQRADMADYFQRLRAAQAAANIPAPPPLLDEVMQDDYDYAAEEGAAATVLPQGRRLVVKKSQPGGIKKRTKLHQSKSN